MFIFNTIYIFFCFRWILYFFVICAALCKFLNADEEFPDINFPTGKKQNIYLKINALFWKTVFGFKYLIVIYTETYVFYVWQLLTLKIIRWTYLQKRLQKNPNGEKKKHY